MIRARFDRVIGSIEAIQGHARKWLSVLAPKPLSFLSGGSGTNATDHNRSEHVCRPTDAGAKARDLVWRDYMRTAHANSFTHVRDLGLALYLFAFDMNL